MKKDLLIRGGRIIDPGQRIDRIGSLLISDGKVSWLGGENEIPPHNEYDVLPARGYIVCPGFIDLHCHLREPGFEEKETIATGTLAAAQGGFTTVCCMPNTSPPLDNPATIEYVKSRADKEGVVSVLPIGCVTRGRKGKELAPLRKLASAGVVGFSDDGDPVADSVLMQKALEYSLELGLPIIDHCEDKTLTGGGLVNEGKVSTRLGLRGIPASAEQIMVARDLILAEITGGWVHIAHVTTRGSVELIQRAKERGIHVTAEVTPAHLTLTEDALVSSGTNAKVNPPLRTRKDIRALIQGLEEGVVDAIATDHAPHTGAEKERSFALAPFGISSLETALGSLMKLVHERKLTLNMLISKLTAGPAKIIGDRYGKSGTLAIGAPADIAIFDPDREWVVDTGLFASKGKNTPLVGSVLEGKVMATVYRGKLVYRDASLRVGGRSRDSKPLKSRRGI